MNLDTPLKFIFSHSALREGWDNPNVFQICTLRDIQTERERRQTIGMRWVSHILQALVAAMWRDRAVQRQLALAEKTYTTRRRALLRALAAHGIEAHGKSGLNVWIPVNDESATVQALFQAGWAVHAGESYRIASGPAIRVTIASLSPADAKRFAADLSEFMTARRRSAA